MTYWHTSIIKVSEVNYNDNNDDDDDDDNDDYDSLFGQI